MNRVWYYIFGRMPELGLLPPKERRPAFQAGLKAVSKRWPIYLVPIVPFLFLCLFGWLALEFRINQAMSLRSHLAIALLISTLPSIVVMVLMRHQLRRCVRQELLKRGFQVCLKCGYDLRGSSERCPECGTGFEEKVKQP